MIINVNFVDKYSELFLMTKTLNEGSSWEEKQLIKKESR
jgi:hypothetical protein